MAELVARPLCVNRWRQGGRVAVSRTGISDGKVINDRIGFFEVEVACFVTVEVCFDIQLIVTELFIASYHAEEKTCPGGCRVEIAHFGWIRVHGNEVRSESGRRNGSIPVEISSHPYGSANTHGKRCVVTEKQEVGCGGILEVAELVIIEVFDK